MKIALDPFMHRHLSLEALPSKVAELGYEWIELSPRADFLEWFKAPRVFRFARALRLRKPDPRAAMAAMPPLLRSYLAMGGWVSDHAVVDDHLDTLHVFTGLEIRAIPPARARLLRAAGA